MNLNTCSCNHCKKPIAIEENKINIEKIVYLRHRHHSHRLIGRYHEECFNQLFTAKEELRYEKR